LKLATKSSVTTPHDVFENTLALWPVLQLFQKGIDVLHEYREHTQLRHHSLTALMEVR